MKRTLASIAMLAVALATAAVAQTGSTPTAPATTTSSTPATSANSAKVGIVNIQQAIVATNEGAHDFDALQKKFEPRRVELQNLSTEVENLKKQLSTQGDKMNDDARNNLVNSIASKQKSLQRQAEDAQNDFQQQQQEIAERILQKMAPVIETYAKANGYGMLLDSSNPWPQGPLLWATPGVDLTKAVVDAYNSQSTVAPPAAAPKPTTSGSTKPAGTTAKPAGTTAGAASKPAAGKAGTPSKP